MIFRTKHVLILGFLLTLAFNGSLYSQQLGQNKEGKAYFEQELDSMNIAYQWSEMAILGTANDTERIGPRPTITSRFLALTFVAVFDAWSVYDDSAIPVYLKGYEKQPKDQQTQANKQIAISYAAYRTLKEYYPGDSLVFSAFMKRLGYDPDDNSLNPDTAVGIGNLAAKATLTARHHDGANQYGEVAGFSKPYADYTNYKPVNTVDQITDYDRWQPKYFEKKDGKKFAPACLTPFWQLVEPIALKSADQFRPGPPPRVGSEQLKKEVEQVVEFQANLTDEQKALVEFMRDGPQSVQQAGHWLKFAQQVSKRDKHSLDEDVKMFFINQVAAMDAFIASWDSKMFYDSARPFALVHYYFKDKEIKGWKGPGKGIDTLGGEDWRPYSPSDFLCPPFPSYTSGHSTISGACAEVLRLWTGSDSLNVQVALRAGQLTEPEALGEEVILDFPTFTQAAEMAGISRVMGGYHIQSDNIAGLTLGRAVAHRVWDFYNEHLGN
ncbi:vanadium-dependent haloperoxidase [Leeuwenhoekiella marinoflava]|uniref:PAP2 superfamily protein n=2 Tax=Leeuwenhoekiella marinoflava TaxID=988 RepID=A0A4Q0PPD6_9FLAO|nr:vanadium-dependent haloperoxidase [Leeuwenhoekiella marinoflava]RXG32397.1 PAP2 superfamily protein [Leeuwenhoekiella marinoflava]SHE73221.1 PAP2 superfamily protein [Leeuwenhoekiella marinoflava DSM 3653]